MHHAISAAVCLLLLVLAHLWPLWQPLTGGVVTPEWASVLWAVELSLLVQLAGHVALAVSHVESVKLLIEWCFSLVGLVGAVVMASVFPFDFSRVGGPWLDVVLRSVAVLGAVGAGIRLLFHCVLLLLGPRPPGHTTARPPFGVTGQPPAH